MKKFLSFMVIMALAIASMAVSAQTVESSRFFDNWSVGLKGGITSPVGHGSDFFDDARPIVGVELTKKLTPIISMGVEGAWTINTSPIWFFGQSNGMAFDRQYVGGLLRGNLTNAVLGYSGTPRWFEVEAVGGLGWQHDFFKHGTFANTWYSKWGLDFNFNLGKDKEWTVAFKPDIVFAMEGPHGVGYNVNCASVELMAGVTYHFKNHNGTHSFVLCNKRFTQEEWDNLNGEVNRLRQDLEDCQNRAPQIVEKEVIKEVVVEQPKNSTFPPINFNFASAKLSNANERTIAWMASEINKSTANVVVKGFASEEGSTDFNKALSLKRAEAVKKALIKHGVDAARIEAVGDGATTQFGTNRADNRIVITIM